MFIGAIDIGGTKTIVALVTPEGIIKAKDSFSTNINDWEKHFLTCTEKLITLCSNENTSSEKLIGIGINLPGMTDAEKGILIRAPYSQWEQVPVRQWFSEKLGNKNIEIENDVNSCAVGELVFGYKDTYRDFLWMTVSTGVGGAVVSQGKLIRGYSGLAGEMGHVKVEYEHPRRCPCAQDGCLEAHGSGTAITRLTKELAVKDENFAKQLSDLKLEQNAKGCGMLAEHGNQKALEIYHCAAEYLGRGMSYYINLINPQAIIVGGGVGQSLEVMKQGILEALSKYVINQALPVDIVKTKLCYEAAVLGAAALIVKKAVVTA